jgi:molecular chaperone DnaK (HSP70)
VSGSDPVIGIDLGTTNSVAARCDETGTPMVLADDKGGKIHPSVVSFHPNGSVVVGPTPSSAGSSIRATPSTRRSA